MKLRFFGFITVFLLAIFAGTNVLLSPSHPVNLEEATDSGQYADPEAQAKLYGVDFPIADLGNCQNSYSSFGHRFPILLQSPRRF